MPIIATPSPLSSTLFTLQSLTGPTNPTPLPSLTLGERLEVIVLQRLPDGKALLRMKNESLAVSAPLTLSIGQQCTVRVAQLHPRIVLQLLNKGTMQDEMVNDLLKHYRSHPDSIKQTITHAMALATPHNIHALPQPSKGSLQVVGQLAGQLVVSRETLANPLFLKHFVHFLGMTKEWTLMKALNEPTVLQDIPGINWKDALLRLSEDIASQPSLTREMDGEGALLLRQVSDFVHQAVKALESLQAVNVLAGEQEGLFTLQIPLLLQGEIRTQDLFIETDRSRGANPSLSHYRVVLFLDMDALGELVLDAEMRKENLYCTVRCQQERIRNFITPLLPELHEGLVHSGYPEACVLCLSDSELGEWKKAFLSRHELFQQNSVDLSI